MNTTTISRNGKKPANQPPSVKLIRPEETARLVIKKLPGSAIAVLAHEVRNPLTNINLSVELLKSSVKEEALKIYLDIIRRSVLRINGIMSELLKYQEAEEEPEEKCSIRQLLDEVLKMAADRITLKQITVMKLYDKEDCIMVMNKQKMKIALTNIIVNAIEAMDPKKGKLTLITRCKPAQYTIRIEDNGCGISKDNLKKIFTPYFTNKPGGLGLGLSTTYAILRSNHFEVKVESEENKGTRFNLVLEKEYRTRARKD